MSDDVLIEKRDDGVALITLNRPDSLNAMGGQLMPMLAQYLAECASDRSVRCVVLTGAGRAFCAGGDVKGMAAGRDAVLTGSDGDTATVVAGVVAGARASRGCGQSQRATSCVLHTMPKPTIAMVNGHAVGAGLSLALACDLRVASDQREARHDLPQRRLQRRLRRLVLPAAARRHGQGARAVLHGRDPRARRTRCAIGMVNRVVAHDALEDETMALASQLATGPTLAYARMKENLNRGEDCDLRDAARPGGAEHALSGQTSDHREAAKAFVEKRHADVHRASSASSTRVRRRRVYPATGDLIDFDADAERAGRRFDLDLFAGAVLVDGLADR